MKARQEILNLKVLVLALGVMLVGCNLPGQIETEDEQPDAVFTFAAQTVTALVTQDAPDSQIEDEGPMVTVDLPVVESTQPEEPSQTPEPTQTQEPTVTITPTATPSPTPIPDAILEDDFSNTNLWYTDQNDDYGFEYKDDGYRIYNNILNAAIWSVRSLEYSDIRLEIDTTRKSGPDDGYFGVVCRFGNEGLDYYALVIGDNGFYGILEMDNGDLEFLGSGMDEDGVIHLGMGETNRVRGVCSGEQLVLYANDQQLLEVFDDSHSNGEVGLVVGNRLSDVGIDVIFDNFAIMWP
jgi:hypothetical protein